MKKTEIEIGEFKYKPIFQIHQLGEDGKRKERYGLVLSFGVAKAAAILENLEEIKKFVEDNKKDG